MKVRCVELLNWKGEREEWSAWLKLGHVYHVLELAVDHGKVTVRLMGEEKTTPAIFDLRQFEIVSGTIPDTWIVNQPSPDYLELTTAAWARPGFWEKFFDRDPVAAACFDEERKKIVAADP